MPRRSKPRSRKDDVRCRVAGRRNARMREKGSRTGDAFPHTIQASCLTATPSARRVARRRRCSRSQAGLRQLGLRAAARRQRRADLRARPRRPVRPRPAPRPRRRSATCAEQLLGARLLGATSTPTSAARSRLALRTWSKSQAKCRPCARASSTARSRVRDAGVAGGARAPRPVEPARARWPRTLGGREQAERACKARDHAAAARAIAGERGAARGAVRSHPGDRLPQGRGRGRTCSSTASSRRCSGAAARRRCSAALDRERCCRHRRRSRRSPAAGRRCASAARRSRSRRGAARPR